MLSACFSRLFRHPCDPSGVATCSLTNVCVLHNSMYGRFYRCCYQTTLVRYKRKTAFIFTQVMISFFCVALYGIIITDSKETSLSIYSLMQNAGYVVIYFYASALRVRTSIVLQMIYTGIAFSCYTVVEFRQHRKSRAHSETSVLSNIVLSYESLIGV